MPEVSVVIPTHNRARFIEDAVESALRQTFRDREVVVVDDGSTDDTADRLSRFGDRIRVIRKDQGGAASARNRGVAEAKGGWIAFLDSDDLWCDVKIETQMDLVRRHPEYGWIASSYWKLEGGREFVRKRGGRSGEVFRTVWEGNFVRTSTVIINKRVLDAVGPIREDLAINEELDLWLRIARDYPIGYIDKPLALYRHHLGGISRDTLPSRKIYLELLRQHDDPERIPRWASRRRLADIHASVGKHHLEWGHRAAARASMKDSLRLWPFGRKGWGLVVRGMAAAFRGAPENGSPPGEAVSRRSPLAISVRRGDPGWVQAVVHHYQADLESGGVRILREGHRTRVVRRTHDGKEILLKHYRAGGLRAALRVSAGGSWALAAAEGAAALEKRGLGAPRILGVADRTLRGAPYDSIILMEPVPGAVELDRRLCRFGPGKGSRPAVRSLARSLAASFRRMHEGGIHHADLKSCNILVRGEAPSWEFLYLDLEDVRDCGAVPLADRLENLAQINATVPSWVSRTDRLRFFLVATGKDRLDRDTKDQFRKVWKRSREKDRVFYDDDGVVRESWEDC